MSLSPPSSVVDRAFSPPSRSAPLAALASELRRPGVWIQVCRRAMEREPAWLEARLAPGDPLLAAIGRAGDATHDTAVAGAVCSLALGLCGQLDEAAALAAAARVLGEDAPAELGLLDAGRSPSLADLVAALRGDPIERIRRSSTVVEDQRGAGRPGSVTVSLHPEREPGLRLDAAMRIFAPPDPVLESALATVRGRIGCSPGPLRARVETEVGEVGGGDACAAAILVAVEALERKRSLSEEVVIVGAVGGDDRLGPSVEPDWDAALQIAAGMSSSQRLVAGAGGISTVHSLRRAVGAPARRRRIVVAIALVAIAAAVAAAFIVPSLGAEPKVEEAAAAAVRALPASPLHAALDAAHALSIEEDGLSRKTAAEVLATAPLTEATGQETGHLLAVGINGTDLVTTVSTRGRATRWRLRGGHLDPVGAVEFPAGSTFVALSESGRWLLVRPPESYERMLLIDTAGRRSSRYLVASEKTFYAVGGGGRPILARGGKKGLTFDRGIRPMPSVGDVEAVSISPSGRLLAVAASRRTAIFRRQGKSWKLWRKWQEEVPAIAGAEVARIEVDDRGETLASLEGLGTSLRWSSPHQVGEYETADGFGSLAGRSLYLLPSEHRLQLMQETSSGPAMATSFPAPVDGATKVPVAVSPAGDAAVVAGPDGLFSVIDLRRVRLPGADVVTDSVVVRADRLSFLAEVSGGSQLVSWDLRTLEPPRRGPVVPAEVRLAAATAGGRWIATTSDRPEIVIRNTLDGRVVGTLRGRGGESWSTIAADGAGTILAAVDESRDQVTVWKLARHGPGKVVGHVVYRGRSFDRPDPVFPDPLAVSPNGRTLVYGTASQLFARDLRTGVNSPLATGTHADVIRVRFGQGGRRIILAGATGVTQLSGPGWSQVKKLSSVEAHDAGFLRSGYVAAAGPVGVQLLTGHDPVQIDQGVDSQGIGPGTVSISEEGGAAVPEFEELPLVVLRIAKPDEAALCALAGGRAPASGGCGERPALPPARPAVGSAADRPEDSALSPSGLGAVQIGKPVTPSVARLPAYSWDGCAARTLPGRGAIVISDGERVESITLLPVNYADQRLEPQLHPATDEGLTPEGAYSARKIYGPPAETSGDRWRWWLSASSGARRQLSVSRDYSSPAPVTMSVADPVCKGWWE